jgi:anti-anti-sigma factor
MKALIKTTNHRSHLLIEFLFTEFNLAISPTIMRLVTKALKKYDYPHVVFDLGNIEYIDSIGIGFFITIRNVFKEHKKHMFLVSTNERIIQVFENINMNRFCQIFRSGDDAAKAIEDTAPGCR